MRQHVQCGYALQRISAITPRDVRGRWLYPGLAFLLFLYAGCGVSGNSGSASGDATTACCAYVSFASLVSYPQALRAITDSGLRLGVFCPSRVYPASQPNPSHGPVQALPRWQPVGQQAEYAKGGNELFVAPTPLAATDWVDRLGAMVSVREVRTLARISCPPPVPAADTPAPDAFPLLPSNQAPIYSRLTFASVGTPMDYGTAIVEVSNMGLRLADPCRERALARNGATTSLPAGQEQTFASAHTLMLATTDAASTHWQEQLQAQFSMISIQIFSTASC